MESRNSHYQTRQATQARLKANFPPIKILIRFLILRERVRGEQGSNNLFSLRVQLQLLQDQIT